MSVLVFYKRSYLEASRVTVKTDGNYLNTSDILRNNMNRQKKIDITLDTDWTMGNFLL